MTDPFYRSEAWRRLRAAALARDGYQCTAPGCGGTHRLTVDHIVSRRRGGPDALHNVRTLCATCDAKVKEDATGRRRSGGLFGGCDADGRPLDPAHWWNVPQENLSGLGPWTGGGHFPRVSFVPGRRRR